ncbi:MAG: aminotransferase class III-fold pyridoxal phosphate-dependent enzyme, partial [Anaerolineae bacterium]|nr:aminotransferase class III-fold pyridoxal phosphate-dependent enzyme [Anaerolineae bacterium]
MTTGHTADDFLTLAARHDADFTPTGPAGPPIVITHGAGAVLTDADGHESLDLTDIIANIGHCHPRHVAALQEAATQMISGKSGLMHPARAELVTRLAALAPENLERVYLVSGGGEAIDWAVRIARRATGRHEILSFWGGIYGRTYAAMSLNGLGRRRRQFGPVMPGVIHAPFPYCYRCPFDKTPDSCAFYCLNFLDGVMAHTSTDDLAAVIVEPYLGVGGIIYPPEGYLPRLQAWAHERGALFILDEVQSSYGRTGKFFALEWEGLRPDMVCIGKGMGGGVPIAALLMTDPLHASLQPGELSGGNGGSPFACASALAVLDIMRDEDLPEHARQVGEYLLGRMQRWQEEFAIIG